MAASTEARIKSLEHRVTEIEADIIEQSDNIEEGFRKLEQANERLFDHVQLGFKQANILIKDYTASKEDLEALEGRVMEEIGSLKRALFEQGQKLDLILQLLKKGE
jgi:hypothetical protein